MQKVLVLNYGGQYDQLIARRIRQCRVFCEVYPATATIEDLHERAPLGIVLTGTPTPERPINPALFDMGVPVLAVGPCCAAMAARKSRFNALPVTAAPQ